MPIASRGGLLAHKDASKRCKISEVTHDIVPASFLPNASIKRL
jgi:hypothetical protein